MQPENQQPDYNFILDPQQPKKGGLLAGANKTKRMVIAAAGGLFLLTMFLVLFSLILGGGGENKRLALRLAQQHTELTRVAEIGEEKARGQAAKNLATTTLLTLQSSQPEILAIAGDVDEKLLAGGQDAETDEVLTAAEQRSQFDEVFTEVLEEGITAYRNDLDTAFSSSSSSKNKEVYSKIYRQLGDIIGASSGSTE